MVLLQAFVLQRGLPLLVLLVQFGLLLQLLQAVADLAIQLHEGRRRCLGPARQYLGG
ncbi:hypothetical protein D3C81_2084990 [compost metagenome]